MGAKEGPGTVFSWTPPSLMPLLLPWIGLALLVLPRQNRSLHVLWLLLPLGLFVLGSKGLLELTRLFGSGGSEQLHIFAQVLTGVAFAQAAIMMLSPVFKGRNRFVTFLGMLLVAAVFGVGSVAVRQDWHSTNDSAFQAAMIGSSVLTLVMFITLSLAGFSCRRRYGWLRFSLWAMLWNIVAMDLVVTILCIVDSGPGFWQAVAVALILAGFSFGVTLPFLIVSFASPFFRTRLIDLFAMQTVPAHPGTNAPITPAAPAVSETIPPVTPGTSENQEKQPQP